MTDVPKIINDIIGAVDRKDAQRIFDLLSAGNNDSAHH